MLDVLANLSKLVKGRPKVLRAVMGSTAVFESHFSSALDKLRVGATGSGEEKSDSAAMRLHEKMLVVLIRSSGYRLETPELLELVAGDVRAGLALVVRSLTRLWPEESSLLVCLVRLFAGFGQPASFFSAASSPVQSFSLNSLHEVLRDVLLVRA